MSGKNGAVFCMIYARNTDRFLVELRSKDVGNPNTYGLFGGAIDDGESRTDAMVRELREEIGTSFNWFDFRERIGKSPVFVYAKILDHEFKPTLSWESAAYKWVFELSDVNPLHKRIRKHKEQFDAMQSKMRNLAWNRKVK